MPDRTRDHPFPVTVEGVTDETPTVRTLAFSDDVMASARPGQFAMVWVPGSYELPMSVMVAPGEGRAAFTVRRHGPASTSLYNVNRGDRIGVRGPYGNSFDVRDGRLLLVGGGTGLVPLMRLASHAGAGGSGGNHRITLVMGARTESEVFFEDMATRMLSACPGSRVVVCTDDGTRGTKGLVTDVVDGMLAADGAGSFDAVYTCGPEPMMYKVMQSAHKGGIFAQASLERVMKCGAGICGSCVAGPDVVCRDGTVFDADHLLRANPEFGRTYRDKSGVAAHWPQP